MDSFGAKRAGDKSISIGSSSKKARKSDPSGICYNKTNLSAEPLTCTRNKCVEGNLKNGVVVSFSVKPNGNSYYKECDECRKLTGEKNPKTNTKVTLSAISNQHFPSKLMGLLVGSGP
jgi:hypothetical protein